MMNPGKEGESFTITLSNNHFKKGDILQPSTERLKNFLGWLGFHRWYHCKVSSDVTQENDCFVYQITNHSGYTVKWFRLKLWYVKIKNKEGVIQ